MESKELGLCCNSLQESHLREAKLQEIVCYLEECFILIRESIQNDQGLDVVDDIAAKALIWQESLESFFCGGCGQTNKNNRCLGCTTNGTD